jgi:hypothetical protein
VVESGLDEEWALNEPAYTKVQADSGFEHLAYPPEQDGPESDMTAPGYLITEGLPESTFGVGSGEELPQMITSDDPEYLSGPLTPFERADFPVNEPWVNIVENIKEIEHEDDVSPVPPPTLKIQSETSVVAPPSTAIKAPDSLEKGKYYVQIGGYSSTERINAIMRDLGIVYPLVVMGQRYILIGPLNEGESNALQQRFRVQGYPNAFVVEGK